LIIKKFKLTSLVHPSLGVKYVQCGSCTSMSHGAAADLSRQPVNTHPTKSYSTGSRLPVLSARHAVTFLATHTRQLARAVT